MLWFILHFLCLAACRAFGDLSGPPAASLAPYDWKQSYNWKDAIAARCDRDQPQQFLTVHIAHNMAVGS